MVRRAARASARVARARPPRAAATLSEIDVLHRIIRLAGSTGGLEKILDEVLGLVCEIATPDAALVYLVDRAPGEGWSLRLAASRPAHPEEIDRIRLAPGEGITGWVAEHRTPVAIAERAYADPRFKTIPGLPEDKYEAFLSVPILRGGELVGVINLQHRSPYCHPPTLVRLVASVAGQVAGIVERERLLDESRRRGRSIGALVGVAGEIVAGPDRDEVLDRIVRTTADHLGFKICSVMILDPARRTLRIAATQSLSAAYRSKPDLPVDGTLSGRTVKERRPLAYRDVRREAAFRFPEIARAEGLVSLLSVPMVLGDEVIGVINAYTDTEADFSAEEVATLQTVANQCALALHHARALRRALEAQEALETRKVVERAKALLMRTEGLTEEAAHREIQKRAMDHRRSVREVAEAILLLK